MSVGIFDDLDRVVKLHFLGSQNDELNAGVNCLVAGILCRGRLNKADGSVEVMFGGGFAYKAINWYAVNLLTAFSGSDTGNDIGACVKHCFCLQRAGLSGDSENNYF